jgi:hypothetical protein
VTSADLPTVVAVVEAFRAALEAPEAEPPGLLGALLGLHRNNLAQWKLEDAARDPMATDMAVATAKRGIDRLNLVRHQLVEQIDNAIEDVIGQRAGAPPSTETPGMAFDRLSVLVIRLHHTEIASGSPAADARLYAARLQTLREHLSSLEAALERLLQDLRNGERSFVPYRHLKLYGPVVERVTPASHP